MLKSVWEHEETLVSNASLAILLPAGITKSDISSQVVQNGMISEVVIDLLKVMTDSIMLFKSWLPKQFDPLKPYHPNIGGFNKALKELRGDNSQRIHSFCHIHPPFTVETQVPLKQVLNFGEGLRVFNVDLKAPDVTYAQKDDMDEVIVN